MSYIPLKCNSCGADLTYKEGDVSVTCKHCGSKFLISEILENKEDRNTKAQNANGQILKTNAEFDISDSAFACLMFIALTFLFSFVLGITGIRVRMATFSYYVLHAIVEGLFAVAAVIVAKTKKKNLIDSFNFWD